MSLRTWASSPKPGSMRSRNRVLISLHKRKEWLILQKNFGHFENSAVVPVMDETSGPPQQSVSPARARRLQSFNAKGKDYRRWNDIEAVNQRILPLHESCWIAEAPDLPNESLLFLIRHVREGNRDIFSHLFEELLKRVLRMARHWVARFDEATRDYLMEQIEIEMIKLVLAETPTRRSDYLDIAFAKGLRQLAFNVIGKHRNSTFGRRGDVIPM